MITETVIEMRDPIKKIIHTASYVLCDVHRPLFASILSHGRTKSVSESTDTCILCESPKS